MNPLSLDALTPAATVAFVVATSFAAGLNVSATVATVGLMVRFGVLVLPPELSIVASSWVIGVALAMFVVEFVLDKIPAVDLIWNAAQTFIRVPAGALLAYGATTQLSPAQQLLAGALGAAVALAAHAGKAALHTSVNFSPEPFSNAMVGVAEDAVAIGLTWFAVQHPYLAAAIATSLIVVIVLAIRLVWRGLLALFKNARQGV